VQLCRYFVSQPSEFYRHNPLCCFSTSVYCCVFLYRLSPETFGHSLIPQLPKSPYAKLRVGWVVTSVQNATSLVVITNTCNVTWNTFWDTFYNKYWCSARSLGNRTRLYVISRRKEKVGTTPNVDVTIQYRSTYGVPSETSFTQPVRLNFRAPDDYQLFWRSWGAGNFSLHHRFQTGSGAHPASYPMGTRGSFPGGVGCEADHSPHLVPRLKNEWSYTSTLQYAFMAWCSVKAQGQLYLTFTFYIYEAALSANSGFKSTMRSFWENDHR
jgi:hypothetical protein